MKISIILFISLLFSCSAVLRERYYSIESKPPSGQLERSFHYGDFAVMSKSGYPNIFLSDTLQYANNRRVLLNLFSKPFSSQYFLVGPFELTVIPTFGLPIYKESSKIEISIKFMECEKWRGKIICNSIHDSIEWVNLLPNFRIVLDDHSEIFPDTIKLQKVNYEVPLIFHLNINKIKRFSLIISSENPLFRNFPMLIFTKSSGWLWLLNVV
jgi:hypothetical protein